MRILIAHNYYLSPGGEDQVFRAEVALLRQQGHEVITWAEDNRRLVDESRLMAAANTIWSRSSQRTLSQLLLEHQPDVVHFHNTFMLISPAAYYTCQEAGIPVVQTLHNYRLLCPAATFFRDGKICEDCLGKWGLLPSIQHRCWHSSGVQTAVVATMLTTHRLLKTWEKQVNLFIALTEFARQKYIAGGLPADKIVVKSNFVELVPAMRPPSAQVPFALFVGRLSTEKGVETLVSAWQHLANIPLKIVGDGPVRPLVEQIIQKFELNQIELLGAQSHETALNLMGQASFLVVPSTWYEGLPLTMIEAFSRRLPVLGSRLGSVAEVVQHGENGILFNPNDADDLARWINWAWEHPTEMRTMADNAYRDFQEKYTASANYQLLIRIYERAMAQPASL